MANKRPNAKKPAALDRRSQAAKLIALGETNPQIALKLKCHEATVSAWRQDASVRSQVELLHQAGFDAAKSKLSSRHCQVVDALIAKATQLDAPGDVKAQTLILSLNGLGATQKVEQTVTVTPLPDEAVPAELARALRALLDVSNANTVAEVKAILALS